MTEIGWKRRRLLEVSKSAWFWCVNNGHTFEEKRGTVVNQKSMDLISQNCKLAKHTFFSRKKEKRLCKRIAERVAKNAQPKL